MNYKPLLLLALKLLLWESIVRLLHVPLYLFPPPSIVFLVFLERAGYLFFHLGITLMESFFGFLIGGLGGVMLGAVGVHFAFFRDAVYPLSILILTTPTVAIAPLLILWFGDGMTSKIVASALVCFFPLLVNAAEGFGNISKDHLDLFTSYGASSWKTFLHLRFYHALPSLFSGMKIAMPVAVLAAIVAEFTGANAGIGLVMVTASYLLETPLLFAAIILASLGGMLFFFAIVFLEKKMVYWAHIET